MAQFFKTVKQTLKNAFLGTQTPSSEENRLFVCVASLGEIQKMLEDRLLPMLEVNNFLRTHPSKEPMKAWDIQEDDATTWSFSQLLTDKLQQKGWNVYSQEGQDMLLCHALDILTVQGESSRLSFDMVLAGYKKDEHKTAVKFMCERVSDLEDVIADLQKMTAADITDKHKMTLLGSKSIRARNQQFSPPSL